MNELPPPALSSRDTDQLRLLSIFHFVMAGLSVLGGAFIFMHYMIMSTVFTNPQILAQMKQQSNGQKLPFDPSIMIHVLCRCTRSLARGRCCLSWRTSLAVS